MEKNLELLLKAMLGDADACFNLAMYFSENIDDTLYKDLCRVFLYKAIELGNEESFFAFQKIFKDEKIDIDEQSYRDILKDLNNTNDQMKKDVLMRYLGLHSENR